MACCQATSSSLAPRLSGSATGFRWAKAVLSVAKYIVGWQRPGDFGFIVAEQNGKIVGAAWARRLSAEQLKFPYRDEETPKVMIGVKPNARSQGVGEKLMRALIGEAARHGLGLSLSVRSKNPARRLYERLGFRDIPGSAAPNELARRNWPGWVRAAEAITSSSNLHDLVPAARRRYFPRLCWTPALWARYGVAL